MDGFWNSVKNGWSWLPTITGLIGGFFGIVLSLIHIYESRTFQHWKNNFLMKRRARKLARLQRRAIETAASIQALQAVKDARKVAATITAEAVVAANSVTEETAMSGAIAHKEDRVMVDDKAVIAATVTEENPSNV